MQDQDNDERSEKHPSEMTSDELLEYSIAPEVAERLKARVREDCDPEDSD
jgi:hypothetical protein